MSTNPCSDLYCGDSAGSELETQLVQNEAARLAAERKIPGWVTIHSYGYMWMFPWGNTINHAGQVCERADDHEEMVSMLIQTILLFVALKQPNLRLS